MAYRITVRILNDTDLDLTVIENTCWKGAGTAWTHSDSGYHLSMKGSGTSGMLRLRSSEGEHFSVAVGVHNFKRWCDVDVNLSDSDVLTLRHPAYYDENNAKWKVLWAQATRAEGTSSKGRKFVIEFKVVDGNNLRANLTLS
ncbi:fruit body lectin [Cercophora newfieldiana]|uniref:Fruit body lectin n=1 Tax=Cercophora newfieldiana TaxID=92897 RepID=A0AA40CKE0_9PEZI|nr:fruit body lectin [Cercophora newfieldiana]